MIRQTRKKRRSIQMEKLDKLKLSYLYEDKFDFKTLKVRTFFFMMWHHQFQQLKRNPSWLDKGFSVKPEGTHRHVLFSCFILMLLSQYSSVLYMAFKIQYWCHWIYKYYCKVLLCNSSLLGIYVWSWVPTSYITKLESLEWGPCNCYSYMLELYLKCNHT